MMSEHADFDEAVLALVQFPEAGPGDDLADEVAKINAGLTRFLVAGFPALKDPEEVASESIVRLLEAARGGRVDTTQKPAAYLTRIARNAAIDRLRRDQRVEVSPDLDLTRGADDDAVVRLLDSSATCQLVGAGIQAAHTAGDHGVVQVVTHWIDLAQELSRAPTSREVGNRAGVSHTAVREALDRFRRYLPNPAPET